MFRSRAFVFAFTIGLVVLSSGCKDMGVAPPAAPTGVHVDTSAVVSFKNDVHPIFVQFGCDACHGGTNGLYVQTVAQLLTGGVHGPAIVPGKADSSLIMKKTSSAPPFGERMPFGGPYCPDSVRAVIAAWINQGAKDN